MRELWDLCLKRRLIFLGMAGVFLTGILFGLFFPKPLAIQSYFLTFADRYLYLVFSDCSIFEVLFGRLFSCLIYVLVALAVSLSCWLFPVHLLFVFFKGFVCGSLCAMFVLAYSVSGMFVVVLLYVPQTLLFSAVFIGNGLFCLENTRAPLDRLVSVGAAAVCAALWECLIIFLLFRPLCLFA